MFDLNTFCKNQSEQISSDHTCCGQEAIVLSFPYSLPQTAKEPVPVALGDDIIMRRMGAPLCSNEMTAVLDMIKYRAKQSGQAIWITTGMFLAVMGVEELGDIRRSDFVRAVEHLMPSTLSTQTQSAT